MTRFDFDITAKTREDLVRCANERAREFFGHESYFLDPIHASELRTFGGDLLQYQASVTARDDDGWRFV